MNTTTRGSWVLALALAALPAGARAQDGAQEAAPEAAPAAASAETADGAGTAQAAPPPSGRVTRASFTTAVVDREPQGSLTQLSKNVPRVAFFTELQGFQGQTLTHVWRLDGVEMARVPFQVAGPRWRVYSTKNLDPGWIGSWEVTVEDSSGRVLERKRLPQGPGGEATLAGDASASEAAAQEAENVPEEDMPLPASIDLE